LVTIKEPKAERIVKIKFIYINSFIVHKQSEKRLDIFHNLY